MKEYPKIETLYKRDEVNHKVLLGNYRNPAVEQCRDLQWQFTEKIDGTNVRIYFDGHKVQIGGRTSNAQLHTELVMYLAKKFLASEVEQIFEQKFGDKEVYLFGEGYGAGIQTGGNYRADKSLMIFDAQVNGVYVDREGLISLSEVFGVEVAPILCEGCIQDSIKYVTTHEFSSVGNGRQPLEGVVGRLREEMFDKYGNRLMAKIKREDFING